jgi:hypothetical protein
MSLQTQVTDEDMADLLFQVLYPYVSWTEPIPVKAAGSNTIYLACLLCSSRTGILHCVTASISPQEFRKHIADKHSVSAVLLWELRYSIETS